MLEFIVEYWVQTLLTAIIGGLSFTCKKLYALYTEEKKHKKDEEQQEFYARIEKLIKKSAEESRAEDAKLQEQINIMQNGILSIQGKNFKQECRALLSEKHEITLQEFEAIQDEHCTYNSLGGNHDGDMLYDMVVKKATKDITN